MIDNDYICELDLNLDMTYIKGLIARQLYATKQGLAGHQRLVKDDPYLTSIREKLPFLSSYYNIYKTNPSAGIVLHIDAKRNCAFNIPIENTENSKTNFYEFTEDPVLVYNNRSMFNEVKSGVKEVFSYTLVRPVLINNSVPHEVKHNGSGLRIILSWSVKQELTYLETKELFKKCIPLLS